MRGRGRSHGVRYRGSDVSGYSIELCKVFAIFILVCTVASSLLHRPLGLSPAQNRYLPIGYTICTEKVLALTGEDFVGCPR